MLKTLLFPAPAIVRSVRRFVIPSPPAVPHQLFDVSWSRGTVTRYVESWHSHTTHGGGDGYMNMYKGTGSGYINPVWSRTERWKRMDWDINVNGKRHPCWLERFDHVVIRQGDEVGVLIANGQLAQVVNYTDDMAYCITSRNYLIPQAPVQGVLSCLGISLCVAPFATVIGWGLLAALVGAIYGKLFGRWEHSWLADLFALAGMLLLFIGPVLVLIRLFTRRRQSQANNATIWQRGCAELTAWCRKCLGVDGHWP